MLTSRLCVVHCLPSAIHLGEYMDPDAFWACAERRCNEVLRDPNAILSAIDTTQTRIGLVVCLTVLMDGLHRTILPVVSCPQVIENLVGLCRLELQTSTVSR